MDFDQQRRFSDENLRRDLVRLLGTRHHENILGSPNRTVWPGRHL